MVGCPGDEVVEDVVVQKREKKKLNSGSERRVNKQVNVYGGACHIEH